MAVNRLLRFGFARPHVFVAAVPGGLSARLGVERYAREHGWPLAASPADADILVVCGEATDWLADAVDVVWRQVPRPRARIDLSSAEGTPRALERARQALLEPEGDDATDTQEPGAAHDQRSGMEHQHDEHAEHTSMDQHAEHEAHAGRGSDGGHDLHVGGHSPPGGHGADAGHDAHAEHEGPAGNDMHADHDSPGGDDSDAGHHMHAGHDTHAGHHGHGGVVAGLPMADRGPDRDGLNLDQVEVALGPFLPAWPLGLRLRLTMQGDVAHDVAVDQLGSHHEDELTFAGSPRVLAAGYLDALVALLDVVGDEGSATRARRLRDELLDGTDVEQELRRFAARLRRSRLFRAATDGVAVVDETDATARWQGWLDAAQGALAGEEVDTIGPAVPADTLPHALAGLELGGLRIAVASLVPPTGVNPTIAMEHHHHG